MRMKIILKIPQKHSVHTDLIKKWLKENSIKYETIQDTFIDIPILIINGEKFVGYDDIVKFSEYISFLLKR